MSIHADITERAAESGRTFDQQAAYERMMGDSRTVAAQREAGILDAPKGAPADKSTDLLAVFESAETVSDVWDSADSGDLIVSVYDKGTGRTTWTRGADINGLVGPDADVTYWKRGLSAL